MSDREAFLRAIAEAPEDDAPRLVFADWLEEHGDAERAEFVRLQCRLAALGPEHPDFLNLTIRSNELLLGHERTWLGEWCERLVRWRWRRGFLHAVTVTPGPFLRHGGELFRQHPTIWQVAFVDENGEPVSAEAAEALAAAQHMAQVRSMDVTGGHPDEPHWWMYGGTLPGAPWCQALARAAHVTRLEELFLGVGTRDPAGSPDVRSLEALTRAPHLGTLRVLDIGYWAEVQAPAPAGEVVRLLAESSFAARLTSLNLDGCALTEDEARRLADRATFPSLRRLHWVLIPDRLSRAREILVEAAHLSVRTERGSGNRTAPYVTGELATLLTLVGGYLSAHQGPPPDPMTGTIWFSPGGTGSPEGLRALASSPLFATVHALDLFWDGFSQAELQPLFASPHLRGLESLHIGGEYNGAADLPARVDPDRFPRLRDVVISTNTDYEVGEAMRRRFGPRLRVWHDC